MRIYTVLLSAFLTLMFTACQQNPMQTKVLGAWEYSEVNIGGQIQYAKQMANSILTFNADGKYSMDIAGAVEEGEWAIEDSTITLKSITFADKPSQRLFVRYVNEGKMIYESDNDVEFVITMIRKED